MPASTYSPYYAPGNFVPALLGPDPSTVGSPLGHTVVQQAVPVAQQKIARSDRLEVSSFIHIHVTFYRIPIYLYINEKKTKITINMTLLLLKPNLIPTPQRYFNQPGITTILSLSKSSLTKKTNSSILMTI